MTKPAVPRPAPASDRPGQSFQDLVAAIERAITGENGVTMETNVRVRDADDDLREHDILLTHTEGLRVTKTAVECKDHGRKIGKPELEAFRSKCQDTGIHKGVMVSSSGFAESALRASRRTNVQCLELAKVETFPWVGQSAFHVSCRDFSSIDVEVFAATPIVEPFRLFGVNGELTMGTYKHVCQLTIIEAPELSALGRDEPATISIHWKPSDGAYVVDANGERHDVDHLMLRPTFTVTDTPQAFELHSYSGDSGRLEVATTDFNEAGLTGKLVMVRDEKSIRLTIQPKPSSAPE
jgi:hypothetical protein